MDPLWYVVIGVGAFLVYVAGFLCGGISMARHVDAEIEKGEE